MSLLRLSGLNVGDQVFPGAITAGSANLATGSITASKPFISGTQTWNNGAVAFTAISAKITNTASAGASLLIDLQVDGVSKFNVDESGTINAQVVAASGAITGSFIRPASYTVATLPSAAGAQAGSMAWVTDATQTFTSANFGTTVTGGGANGVPVVSDGTNWKIG